MVEAAVPADRPGASAVSALVATLAAAAIAVECLLGSPDAAAAAVSAQAITCRAAACHNGVTLASCCRRDARKANRHSCPTDILLMPGASCPSSFPASSACCCCSRCRALLCCRVRPCAACSLASCCRAASAAAVDGFGPGDAVRSAWLIWDALLAELNADRSPARFAAARAVLAAAAEAGAPQGLLLPCVVRKADGLVIC